jgi:ABC-type multidrug transport system permease subunit
MLRQVIAFTKRDAHKWSTYKTAAITQLISVLIGILAWGITAAYRNRLVPEYNTDYISFLIVGLAISNIIMPLVQGVEKRLNPWTLETILMTGISTPVFVIGNISWNYIFSVVIFIPQLIIGIQLFNAVLNLNILSTVVAFAISAMILLGLAMISTGMRFITKSTDPITWAINTLSQLASGMAFPVQFLDSIFPGASAFSWILPQTWVYHLCRQAMLMGLPITDPQISSSLLSGLIFALILFPTGYIVFRWGLRKAKRDGTLGWF